MNLPFAENTPYYKTGKSSPSTWLDKTASVIRKLGGRVVMRS